MCWIFIYVSVIDHVDNDNYNVYDNNDHDNDDHDNDDHDNDDHDNDDHDNDDHDNDDHNNDDHDNDDHYSNDLDNDNFNWSHTCTIGGTSRATFVIPAKRLNITIYPILYCRCFRIVTAETILKLVWTVIFIKTVFWHRICFVIFNHLVGISNTTLLVPPIVHVSVFSKKRDTLLRYQATVRLNLFRQNTVKVLDLKVFHDG